MTTQTNAKNKGEWSELYAFIKLLKEGRIYAADENVNRLDNIYLPIIKIIREEVKNENIDYFTGDIIRIYKNNCLLEEIPANELDVPTRTLFEKIFEGSRNSQSSGAFTIEEAFSFMERMHIRKVKAPSIDKIDLTMQIHDIYTGYSPEVGFSVKSDVGSPPTLLNAGKNTRIQYKVMGLNDLQIEEINNIDETVDRNYMVMRISRLFALAENVSFEKVKDQTFNDNLIMIDSLLPRIYGEMILKHYSEIESGIYDCDTVVTYLTEANPMHYHNPNVYKYKIKKLITASALGMTPGKEWDGLDSATGGYIIIKRDGDVLCYHLYNRNFFEEYLLKNTRFDRPSASRYDYGYLYKENDEIFIDLNVQIRFKSIR